MLIINSGDIEEAFGEMRSSLNIKNVGRTMIYEKEYKRVFEEAKNTLSDCNFSIKESNIDSGTIKANVKMSIWSWGENIEIFISKTSVGTKVTFSSSAKAQLFDWGKSKRNINNFFEKLSKRLETKI